MSNVIVIKVGGSTLSPSISKIFDFEYAKSITEFISKYPEDKFIIICGGGELARQYQKNFDDGDLNAKDMVGIIANDTNARLLSQIVPNSEFKSPSEVQNTSESNRTIIVGGSDPGHTGDFVAVELANRFSAKKVILLKDVEGVYNKDPKLNPDSKLIQKMSWSEYRNLFEEFEYKPKISLPVDPTAANFADQNNIKLNIASAKDFENLKNLIEDKNFEGTIIE